MDQKPGEAALNQSEGINQAQTSAKKNKLEGQKKQTSIYSTQKDKSNVKAQLNKTKTLKDATENY